MQRTNPKKTQKKQKKNKHRSAIQKQSHKELQLATISCSQLQLAIASHPQLWLPTTIRSSPNQPQLAIASSSSVSMAAGGCAWLRGLAASYGKEQLAAGECARNNNSQLEPLAATCSQLQLATNSYSQLPIPSTDNNSEARAHTCGFRLRVQGLWFRRALQGGGCTPRCVLLYVVLLYFYFRNIFKIIKIFLILIKEYRLFVFTFFLSSVLVLICLWAAGQEVNRVRSSPENNKKIIKIILNN